MISTCIICGKSYVNTDDSNICSRRCDNELERRELEAEAERERVQERGETITPADPANRC